MANVKGMTKQSVIRYIVTSLQRIYGSTTQRFNDLTWRSRSSLSARCAFTLIELIVVVTVIVILTGLVLSTVGYVQKKAARSRAETEIAAMSAALESYKADNGVYVRDCTTTSQLVTNSSGNPSDYQQAGLYLYKQLSGDTNANQQPPAGARIYFTFKPQMLVIDGSGHVTAIKDPFGNNYGYSTAYANYLDYQSGLSSCTPPSPAPTGYNPTFDLWSTAGLTSGTDSTQWIKNW
jgi:general secretion pathway protein G